MADATLTYVYADSTAVLGPLATYAEPHCYDLCQDHAARLTVPLGWEVVRLDLAGPPRTLSREDLSALVEAGREKTGPAAAGEPARTGKSVPEPQAGTAGARRSHLRVLREED